MMHEVGPLAYCSGDRRVRHLPSRCERHGPRIRGSVVGLLANSERGPGIVGCLAGPPGYYRVAPVRSTSESTT